MEYHNGSVMNGTVQFCLDDDIHQVYVLALNCNGPFRF